MLPMTSLACSRRNFSAAAESFHSNRLWRTAPVGRLSSSTLPGVILPCLRSMRSNSSPADWAGREYLGIFHSYTMHLASLSVSAPFIKPCRPRLGRPFLFAPRLLQSTSWSPTVSRHATPYPIPPYPGEPYPACRASLEPAPPEQTMPMKPHAALPQQTMPYLAQTNLDLPNHACHAPPGLAWPRTATRSHNLSRLPSHACLAPALP